MLTGRSRIFGLTAVGLTIVALALGLSACVPKSEKSSGKLAVLIGRAVLPADTFLPGSPPVGIAMDPEINGRQLPFGDMPVQGISSLIPRDGGRYVALQDNGFGSMANSPDYPLGWFHLHLDLDDPPTEGGPVEVSEFVYWSDPARIIPFAITLGDSVSRPLTGADFDPESFVRMNDGSFWVGEEFGPSMLHVGPDGVILEKPLPIPVVPPLRPFSRGSPVLRTPDHPDLRFLRNEKMRLDLANLPRSGGIEGLARNASGDKIYAAVEKPMSDDSERTRRVILEFDPARHGFSGAFWLYRADRQDISLASLEAVTDQVFLVLERDPGEGLTAEIKRIYRIDLEDLDQDGNLNKTLVCDLMDIRDSQDLTRSENGAVGLGEDYSFPYVTPESLAVIDDRTLLVANDNNFPLSTGRRPPDTPDDSEFILLRLSRSLIDGD
ncbi:MAG: esterase-like activity of phytase family protein [Candidatus Krumholzibacteriota bacterium]